MELLWIHHHHILADIFMPKLESNKLNGLINQGILFKRYVDDILCIDEEIIDLDYLVISINSIYGGIWVWTQWQWISLMQRFNNCLKVPNIEEYTHKPTWISRYIHFNSYVPPSKKN